MTTSCSPTRLLLNAGRAGHVRHACHGRRGFTLLEVLVAVGAVALVSVGIAAIFDSVGKTVNAGRRISRNQAIFARVEQQMRKDLAQISREGFLVIRQQLSAGVAGSGNTSFPYAVPTLVTLSDRDVDVNKRARDRRIDEIMFFSKGQYTSVMEPLTTRYGYDQDYFIPRSTEAAIYYGHGQKRAPATDPASTDPMDRLWLTPRLDDDIAVFAPNAQYARTIGLGYGTNPDNPNRYASDWILVRKPTLLIQPRTVGTIPPQLSDTGFQTELLRDSDVQIAGQPAASSIFHRLQRVYPFAVPSQYPVPGYLDSMAFWTGSGPNGPWNDLSLGISGPWGLNGESATRRPLLSSGIVEIATTDLAEIKTIVTTCPARPNQITKAYDTSVPPYVVDDPVVGFDNVFPDQSASTHPAWTFQVGGGRWLPVNAADFGVGTPQGAALFRMHTWMQNALPARSDGFTQYYEISSNYDSRDVGCRVRCESGWTVRDDVIHVSTAAGGPPDPMQTYFRRRNQLALSAHNFLERCSEFMVEWSFGLTDPRNGNLIWYGTPQQQPFNAGDGSREMTMYRGDGNPFDPSSVPGNFNPETIPYNPFQGVTRLPGQLRGNPALVTALDPDGLNAYRVSRHLIYGNFAPFEPTTFPPPENTDACLTSHFGYFDPSFDPTRPSDPLIPASPSFQSLGISSLPWAWPTMVRITVRIADETDPTLEESFQFVVKLPENPRP